MASQACIVHSPLGLLVEGLMYALMSSPFLSLPSYRAGEIGPPVKYSLCKHKSQRSDPQHHRRGAGGMPRSREPVLVIFLVAATKYLIEAVSRGEDFL